MAGWAGYRCLGFDLQDQNPDNDNLPIQPPKRSNQDRHPPSYLKDYHCPTIPNLSPSHIRPLWSPFKEDGSIDGFKGYTQIPDLDFRVTFIPVIKAPTICVILYLDVHFKWPHKQLDIKKMHSYMER